MPVDTEKRRKPSEASRLALEAAVGCIRDDRRIQHPTEIPRDLQFGRLRVLTQATDRPSTVGTYQPRKQKSSNLHGVHSGSSSSYFPHIHEGYVARDVREQKARIRAARARVLNSNGDTLGHPSFLTARGRLQSVGMVKCAKHSAERSVQDITQSLDCDGVEAIHRAFERLGHMDEDEFMSEMMSSLKIGRDEDDSRDETANQLRELFRRLDVNSQGLVTWSEFSDFITMTDVASALDDTTIQKYNAELTPSPLNFVAEIQGMIYLPGADQMVIHDTRGKGFQLYDPPTHRVRSASTDKIHGPIVDAVYTPQGRYIITASTSPVLSFYDVDSLHVRQQIPTKCFQTALALHAGSTQNNVLYSASSDGDVHAWDVSSLTHRHAFFGEKKLGASASVTDLEVLPSSAQLACGSMDGKIYMLDLVAGRVTQTMSGHAKGVSMVRYCSENKYLVSGGIDHKLQVWNPHLEQKVGSLPGHRHQFIGLHVRPDSPEVISADSSGVVKIWDLRKFAAVQTIIKELYVKDHSATVERSMTAMTYIDSQQRIVIAHSSVFFLDPARTTRDDSVSGRSNARSASTQEEERDEAKKPLLVSFNTPSKSFVAITRWEIICWDVATGARTRSTPIPLGLEVTCVAVTGDGYFCFVGCEDGSIARLTLPTAAVVVRKQLHKGRKEVSSLCLLDNERLVLTTANDGNVIVSNWETLEPKFILNHWRGVQSIKNFCSVSAEDLFYSVPLHMRSFFMGNEIERLIEAFAAADPQRTGKISLTSLPHVLERAFPSSSPTPPAPATSAELNGDQKHLTFAMFVEVVKDVLVKTTTEGKGLSRTRISSLDPHPQLGMLVTASSTEAEFCVWNLKNAAVTGEGALKVEKTQSAGLVTRPPPTQSISIVRYLHPLPYFLCVEDNSPHLSIWSSQAMPPFTTHSNMCILRYAHTHKSATEIRSRGSAFFLTEPKTAPKSPERKASAVNESVVIRTVEWFYGDGGDKELLCLGDEAGHIQLLDAKPLLRRLEDIKKHRSSVTTIRPPASGTGTPAVDHGNEGLPSTLLQKVHQWRTTAHDRIGVRLVHVDNVGHLMQPNGKNHVLVVSVDDLGIIKLWSFDGQLLGLLQDERVPRSCWKLRLDVNELKQEEHPSVVAQRDNTTSNQQGESETRPPLRTGLSAPAPSCRLLSIASRQAPRLAEAERMRTTMAPSRPQTVSAEEKLVAWRHSLRTKSSGLSSRRSVIASSGPRNRDADTEKPGFTLI